VDVRVRVIVLVVVHFWGGWWSAARFFLCLEAPTMPMSMGVKPAGETMVVVDWGRVTVVVAAEADLEGGDELMALLGGFSGDLTPCISLWW